MVLKELPGRKMFGISFHRRRFPIFLTCRSVTIYNVGNTVSVGVRNIQIIVEFIILLINRITILIFFSVGWSDSEFMTLHQLRILFCVELNERMTSHHFPIFLSVLRTNYIN
jgi:hypothetical protein